MLPISSRATTYIWSSGNYVPGTTSPAPLLSGDILSIQTGSNKLFANNFTNQSGEVDWLDGFLTLSNVTVTNNSLWRALNGTALNFTGGTFVNNGIFRKEGAGDFLVRGTLVNNGTIDAEVGRISYKSDVTFNSGTVFTGAGINITEGAANFNGAISSTNLVLDGGIATGTGVTLSGTATLSGGGVGGDWTIANGSTLAVTGDSGISGNFTNNGTVDWEGGFLQFSSADVVNNGTWLAENGSTVNFTGGTLVNNGLFRKTGAADVLVRGGFVNNGTIDAEVGTINYKGGVTFNSGTIFTGAGLNQTVSAANFNGAISSTNLLLDGGIAAGTDVKLWGTATLASGGIGGDWAITNGSTLVITGDSGISGDFANNGTVDWRGGFLQFSSANVVNNGTWLAENASTVNFTGGTLVNNGIFRKTGAADVLVRGGFVNNGTIDAEIGTINYKGGVTFNSGTIFTGAGINQTVGAATFNGAISSTNLLLDGGTASGNAAVLSGAASFASGQLGGDWTIANGAMLAINGAGGKGILGSVTNNGAVEWTQGNILLSNGSVLTNKGTINIAGDGDLAAGSGAGIFVNRGLVKKTDGSDTAFAVPVLNFGTIDVEAGSIGLPDDTTNLGTLEGTGMFALSGTLTNAGAIAPGASGTGIGSLLVQGGYTQTSAGILNIQLGAGTLSDLLLVNDQARLGGSLALFCGGCSVSVGDLFTVLDSHGALTGTFANTTASGFNAGFAYTVLYDATDTRVQVRVDDVGTPTPGVPEPASWAMLMLGFGFVGGALRAARVQHRAEVDLPARCDA